MSKNRAEEFELNDAQIAESEARLRDGDSVTKEEVQAFFAKRAAKRKRDEPRT
jgi:hypothetical protein